MSDFAKNEINRNKKGSLTMEMSSQEFDYIFRSVSLLILWQTFIFMKLFSKETANRLVRQMSSLCLHILVVYQ